MPIPQFPYPDIEMIKRSYDQTDQFNIDLTIIKWRQLNHLQLYLLKHRSLQHDNYRQLTDPLVSRQRTNIAHAFQYNPIDALWRPITETEH